MKNKKKAILFTVIAGILWGTSFPAIKIGLEYVDPQPFAFLRFLIASLAMLFAALLSRQSLFNFERKRLILFLGLINGLAYLLQYVGMVNTFASASSLYVNLSVVWVALLSPIILKEHLSAKKVAGVLISLLGVVFMTTNLGAESFGTIDFLGDSMVITAGILWAIFIIYNKPLIAKTNYMIQSMTWILLFTMLPLLPTLAFSPGRIVYLPLNAWLAIIYTAIFCWVLPYYFWLKGLRSISPVTSAVLLLVEIIVAVAISTIFLGETLTVISGIGSIFIIIAILLVS
jgi:drug/metabolite transporter (DMT)-like permease